MDTFVSLMLAAGYVKTVDDIRKFARAPLEEITAGSFTLEPRDGNATPNFIECPDHPGSYLNALGLNNGGWLYLKEHLDAMIVAAGKKRLRISCAPVNPDDLTVLTALLSTRAALIRMEINVGCPNVWVRGTNKPIIGHDPEAFHRALNEVRWHRDHLYIAVKLSPFYENDTLRREIISICCEHDVHEIVMMNTRPHVPTYGMLSVATAGLSGAAIAQEACAEVRSINVIFQEKKINAIRLSGCGGVSSGSGIQAMLQAGAHAVQIGTHAFVYGPRVFEEMLMEL